MNCSRKTKRKLNKIRIAILKVITAIATMFFVMGLCADPEYSDFKVQVIMILVSGGWLFLMGLANDWFDFY